MGIRAKPPEYLPGTLIGTRSQNDFVYITVSAIVVGHDSYHIGAFRVAKMVPAHRRPGKRLSYALTDYGRTVRGLARQLRPV